eukprot:2266867-Alexandrium_andersonii.AAC.1
MLIHAALLRTKPGYITRPAMYSLRHALLFGHRQRKSGGSIANSPASSRHLAPHTSIGCPR